MCFNVKTPAPPAQAPVPNRQADSNQAAVDVALRKAKKQNPNSSTVLTGGLGDSDFGQNVNTVTALGRTS